MEVENKVELTDEEIMGKTHDRAEIDREREIYHDKGGTTKKYFPPYDIEKYCHCDVFIPGEGSIQSEPDIKDTMVRKPRPEKKFGKR